MRLKHLKENVCAANREIRRVNLAILTWGNASEVDREAGVFAIKPSGVDYDDVTPEQLRDFAALAGVDCLTID